MRPPSSKGSSIGLALGLVLTVLTAPAIAQPFTYNPPGQLVAGSGQGAVDFTVYAPGIRFPIEVAPAYVNSQVWGNGGMNGPGGGQCDAANYSYPWWDNFCETRSWTAPMCPTGQGHQGEDIRPSTCQKDVHWALAAEAGTISNIGTYTVTLTASSGTRHRYMHMEPSSLLVSVGSAVQWGDRLGRVSNAFGGTPTTIHLHYEIHQNVSGIGSTPVSAYMSLVASYEELLGVAAQPCALIPPEGGILDDSGPCSRLYGPSASWRLVNGEGYEETLRWTYAFDGANTSNWGQWLSHFAQAGEYGVDVHIVGEYGQSRTTRYVVRHEGQETELVLDQSAGAGWRSLGSFSFSEGGDQFVAVYDNTGEALADQRRITFDAVRFTRKLPPEPVPEAGTDGMPDAAEWDAETGEPSEASPPMQPPMQWSDWSSDEGEGCACSVVGRGRGTTGLLGLMMVCLGVLRRGKREHS